MTLAKGDGISTSGEKRSFPPPSLTLQPHGGEAAGGGGYEKDHVVDTGYTRSIESSCLRFGGSHPFDKFVEQNGPRPVFVVIAQRRIDLTTEFLGSDKRAFIDLFLNHYSD